MPMDFPDLNSLINAAKLHKFRDQKPGETVDQFRIALADHVAPIDFIESEEIRNAVGWNKWNDSQKLKMLQRKFGTNPLR